MSGHRRRVTNGHRAAVCGLSLCGVSLLDACKIVDAPYEQLRTLIPDDFANRSVARPRKWYHHRIEEIGEAYKDKHIPISTICDAYDVSVFMLRRMAVVYGWRRRKFGPVKQPDSFRSMTREQRRIYRKFRVFSSREDALREALR